MSREILLLVDVLAREKNVAKEIVFGALELALASASKKRIHDEADVRALLTDLLTEELRRMDPDDIFEDAAQQVVADAGDK